ncbi:MAG: ferritin-like domain-containing protein [Anaerolineae bacterium]|jgi:bacterioferritin (cytochrome b1)
MDQTEIIEALMKNLRAELSAVEMYGAHAKAITEDTIASGVRAIMMVEQRHARDLADRVSELGGTPAKPGGKEGVAGRAAAAATAQGSTADMLRLELSEEQQFIKDYAFEIAEIMDDDQTLDMLHEHLNDEIEHSRWMKAQLAALGD